MITPIFAVLHRSRPRRDLYITSTWREVLEEVLFLPVLPLDPSLMKYCSCTRLMEKGKKLLRMREYHEPARPQDDIGRPRGGYA